MKRIIIAIVVFVLVCRVQAQENHIIFTEYESDTCFMLTYPDTVYWDLNQDGNHDIYFYLEHHSAGGYMTYMNPVTHWKWSNSFKVDQNLWQPLTDTTIIDESLYWNSGYSFINGYDTPEWWYFAFRHQAEDGIHYGWAHIKCTGYCRFCISGMGYCTLPNQPIQWGQTELLNVEENDESATFATLHPNPTTGLVTITGDNLRQAEVLNVLGQQVLSVQGKGNELHIDMTALPAGIYFVNVIDEEGQKCVRKVVKE